MSSVVRDIGFLINESISSTNTALQHGLDQLEEFKKIDFQNQDMTGKLMAETRDKQNAYMANIENFQASRRVFIIQATMLIDSFASEKIEPIISNAKHEIAKSMTTHTMKINIRKLFDELRDVLQESIDITNETQRLVKAIHKKFKDEYGFKEIEPELFSIKNYQAQLEKIFEEGEVFRNSTKTAMTEQSIVIQHLYSTLVIQARDVLQKAHDDATMWSNTVLTPLMNQIKDHKRQIENRLQMLRKINESKGTVSENIAMLEAEIAPLKRQRDELAMMVRAMHLDSYKANTQ
jgi:predicted hydrocarbon binding protein